MSMKKISPMLCRLTRREVKNTHTAYTLFVKQTWYGFARSGLKPREIFKAASEKWRVLSFHQRMTYENAASRLKEIRRKLNKRRSPRKKKKETPYTHLTGYDLFFDETYSLFAQANPCMEKKSLFVLIGACWRKLTKKQRRKYEVSADIRNSKRALLR
mmetsp:Transcript_11198/g.16937  ORF Transcript_11198/g.16937 Transcript_11198/m.16937 type:complete len:158 (-) Transcript_11198:99-572(-)